MFLLKLIQEIVHFISGGMTQNRKPISSQSLFQLQVSLSQKVKSQKYCKQYSSLDPLPFVECVSRGTEVLFFPHMIKNPLSAEK